MNSQKFLGYPFALWALALFLGSLGFNFKFDIPLALLAFSSLYALTRLDHKGHHIKNTFFRHWHVILFLLASAFVTLCSRNISHSLAVQVQLIPAVLIYLVITHFVSDEREMDFILRAIVFAGVITGVTLLANAAYQETRDPLEKMHSMSSPLFIAPNDVLLLSVIAPLALTLWLNGENAVIKMLSLIYLLIAFSATVYLQSRQGAGILVLSAFIFFLFLKPWHGVMVMVLGLLAVIIFDWILGKGLVKKIFMFPRFYVWNAAWTMFLDRPIVGMGPGMFKELYYEYLEKAGYVLERVGDRRPMNWAHNLYLEQLAERGLVGLTALLILIGTTFRRLVRVWRQELKNSDRIRVAGLMSSIAALILSGIAESSLLRLWVVALLFYLVGYGELASYRQQSTCIVQQK